VNYWLYQRGLLASVATWLLFLSANLGVASKVQAETNNLIVDMRTALATDRLIFDCAGLDRRIRRAWNAKCRPCNTGGHNAIVAFKIDKNDHAYDIPLLGSSGFPACDRAAELALQHASLFYVPCEDAELVFDFNFVPHPPDQPIGRPVGISILAVAEKRAPSIVFVRHDRFVHTELNNKGVIQFLSGNYEAAEYSFTEAIKCESSYAPAVHNLSLLSKLTGNRSVPRTHREVR